MKPDDYLDLTDALPEGMCLLSSKHLILAVNTALSEWLGCPSKNMLGQPLQDFLITPEEKTKTYLKICAGSRELSPGSLSWKTASDTAFESHCEGHIIPPGEGETQTKISLRLTQKSASQSRFSFLNQEIEELRRSHHRIMDQKEQLEAIIAERTNKLKEQATALEKVNQELNQFAYVVSHDLKAPLRAITSLSTWIEEDLQDLMTSDTKKQMQLMRGRVARMQALINGILEYSRIRRIKAEMQTVDVGDLLAETIALLAPPEGFRLEVAPDMPILETHRVQMAQVFANLISNAVKYHDKGKGCIQIQCTDMGTYYDFSVSDDGPGIAPQFHGKIFEIFQTLQARDTFESTGVGLSLVKKIVEEHGGNITLESAEGKGARFQFSWPKKIAARHAA